MIQKATLNLLIVFLFFNGSLFAQNLLQYIPADATMVVGLNPTSVNSKVNVNALKQLAFCQEMMMEMAKGINEEQSGVMNDAINNPAQYGMDFNEDSYFFMKYTEEGTYFSYLFKLSDPPAFSDFFKTTLMNAEKGIRMESKDGMTTAFSEDGSVSWNEQVAIMTSIDLNPVEEEYDYNDWESEEYDGAVYGEEKEEEEIKEEDINVKKGEKEELPSEEWEWEELDVNSDIGEGESDQEFNDRKKVELDRFTKSLFNTSRDSSLLSNGDFLKHIAKRNDLSFWLDYKFVQQMGMTDFSDIDPMMSAFLSGYKDLYGDAFLSMRMNFDPGVIDVKTEMMMNDAWLNYLRATVDAKPNKKFKKYLKGENLLGYMFFNYNMENAMREGKTLMMPMLEAIPMAGPMAEDVLGILDIVVDEEAIYEFFKGDFCLAFTGMREFENRVTTYEYDEEFNATEKEELKKQTLPEFVMMMSYGNEENLKKIFRLGEKMGGLEKKGLYYEIPATTGLGMNMYAAYHKGVLFFTNDTDLVQSKLSTGWASNKRIGKVHRKMMKKNAQVMYWDIPKSINSASELGIPFGLTGDQVVNVSKQSLESVLITAPKEVDENFESQISFRFANKEMNSLEQFFNFINEIYLSELGGKSM